MHLAQHTQWKYIYEYIYEIKCNNFRLYLVIYYIYINL